MEKLTTEEYTAQKTKRRGDSRRFATAAGLLRRTRPRNYNRSRDVLHLVAAREAMTQRTKLRIATAC